MKTLKDYHRTWEKSFYFRKYYTTKSRIPFYEIASKYLPTNKDSIILDIGSGEGDFADYLNLRDKYKNIFLLDSNSNTIKNLKTKYENVLLYNAPDNLPFETHAVSFIHCSHLIEHLSWQQLYLFLKEVNRVLEKNGIFVISSPLLHSSFYNDLTHSRPYNPEVLIKYLCTRTKNQSANVICEAYSIQKLIYRFKILDFDEGFGSSILIIDFLLQFFKKLLSRLSIRKYAKNGYTLVLKKDGSE